jgi:hypothetical protein
MAWYEAFDVISLSESRLDWAYIKYRGIAFYVAPLPSNVASDLYIQIKYDYAVEFFGVKYNDNTALSYFSEATDVRLQTYPPGSDENDADLIRRCMDECIEKVRTYSLRCAVALANNPYTRTEEKSDVDDDPTAEI